MRCNCTFKISGYEYTFLSCAFGLYKTLISTYIVSFEEKVTVPIHVLFAILFNL